MKIIILFILVALSFQNCDRRQCRDQATRCIADEACRMQLKGCLQQLKKDLRTASYNDQKQSEAYAKVQKYQLKFCKCMDSSLTTGSFLGCAKENCPSSYAYFISSLFNEEQSQNYINLEI